MSNKRYLYKVYRDEQYITTLANVVSDFGYSQDINTAGAQLEIQLGSTLDDTGATLDTDELVTETDDNIVTNNGDNILTRKEYFFNSIPIGLANRVKVWLYYDGAVNGTQVFDGLILNFESDYREANLKLSVVSWGVQLDNVMLGTAPSTEVATNTANNSEIPLYNPIYTDGSTIQLGQTFQVSAPTDVGSLSLAMRVSWDKVSSSGTSVNTSVSLIEGTPDNPGSVLGGAQRFISNEEQETITFNFATPISLLPTTTYSILVSNVYYSLYNPVYVASDSGNSYASGSLYIYNEDSGWSQQASTDLTFSVFSSSSSSLTANYNSFDPSAILRSILQSFGNNGGRIIFDADSIDNTNTLVSYEFKFYTTLESIQKCLELAPGNWYWYIDVGENILHFHSQSGTPSHTLVQGKHIENINIKYTLEDMKNIVYFSGGDTGGGQNLLTISSNTSSINNYGQWLHKQSDNRVTLTSTADIIAKGVLSQNSQPTFQTTVTIPAIVYDIETFSLGEMVAFSAFNDFVNSLQMQIVGLDRHPDLITLKLASLLPTAPHRIEDIKRNLERLQTVDNPDTV
jgi:hypothetical protein